MLISTLLQECIDESVIDLTTTNMLNYLKSALRQVSTLLDYRGFLTTGSLTVASSAQSASLALLSSGFILERNVAYLSSGQRVPINRPQSSQYFWSIYNTAAGGGKPQYYLIEGTTIKFEIPLDQTVTVEIDYFKEISAVTLTDTFLGDERLVQAVKHLTKAEYYFEYEEDKDKGSRNKGDGLGLILKIQEDYDNQELGGIPEITDCEGI